MSDTFTAKTGRTVAIKSRSMTGTVLEISGLGARTTVDLGDVETLREFFLHERDKELGRWRWPEDPRYIVKPVSEHVVCVVNEEDFWERPHGRQGEPGQLHFRDVRDCVTDRPLGDSAARYKRAAWAFWQAHPELMPKPWHDARDGQLWLIRFDDFPDTDVSALVKGGRFVYNDHCHEGTATLKDSSIVGGTQIWPEVKP